MHGSSLLISFLVATFGWMLVKEAFAPSEARVSLSGLPTLGDLERAEDLLAAGKLSYKELSEQFSLH